MRRSQSSSAAAPSAAVDAARAALTSGIPGADALVALVEREERGAEELTRLVATAKRISASLDLDVVLTTILEDATALLGASSGDMLFWERDRGVLRVVAVAGLPDAMLGYELRFGEGLSTEAIRTGRTLQVDDYRTYPNRARALDEYRFGSVLCAPLLFHGEAIGALNVHTSDSGRGFAAGDAELLQAFAGLAAIAIDHARRFENEVRLGRQLARTNDDLVRSLSLQQRLADQVLAGGGPTALAAELAAVLDRAVVIEDHLGRPIAGASPDGSDAWSVLTASVRGGRAIDPLPDGDADRTLGIPIRLGAASVGRLVVSAEAAPGPLDRALVDIAATGVALEFAKLRAATDVEQRLRGDVIADLLDGAFTSDAAMAARVARLGYALADLRDVLVIDVGRSSDEGAASAKQDADAAAVQRERIVLDRLTEVLASVAPGSVATVVGRVYVALVTAPRRGDASTLEGLGRILQDGLASVAGGGAVTVALGDPCRQPADFGPSYRFAREALELMARLGRSGAVIGARELGPYRAMLKATDPGELRAFAALSLAPLVEHDRRTGSELIQTLRAYLDSGGVRRRAAERLVVHVNTIVYRLERIERLLEVRLDDPATTFELTLALRILDLAGADEAGASGPSDRLPRASRERRR